MVLICIPCLALLIIFGLLSLFFPRYRPFVKDAWHCFWRKLTLRPCEQSFDQKIKSKLMAYFASKNNGTMARFVNRHYETTMTVIGVVMIVLIVISSFLFIKWILLNRSPCAENTNGTCGLNFGKATCYNKGDVIKEGQTCCEGLERVQLNLSYFECINP